MACKCDSIVGWPRSNHGGSGERFGLDSRRSMANFSESNLHLLPGVLSPVQRHFSQRNIAAGIFMVGEEVGVYQ